MCLGSLHHVARQPGFSTTSSVPAEAETPLTHVLPPPLPAYDHSPLLLSTPSISRDDEMTIQSEQIQISEPSNECDLVANVEELGALEGGRVGVRNQSWGVLSRRFGSQIGRQENRHQRFLGEF